MEQTYYDHLIDELRFIQDQEECLAERRGTILNLLGSYRVPIKKNTESGEEDEGSESDEDSKVRFVDAQRLIQWSRGRITFRQSGIMLYKFIKIVWEAGEVGVEQLELAEEIYGDSLASIKEYIKNARQKLEENRFPKEIMNDGKKVWFS